MTADPTPSAPLSATGLIRAAMPKLSGALRDIADSVLADLSWAARASIADLAERSGSSPASVTRFCREVGLDSFRTLRLTIAEELGRGAGETVDLGPGIHHDDPLDRVAAVILNADIQAMQQTAAQLDLAAVDSAARAVAGAGRVDVYGIAGSATSASELTMRLFRIGTRVAAWSDNHQAETSAHLLNPGDVAIALSHSGATREVVEPLTIAAKRGATTVAITNFPRSPLAKAADHVLTTAILETSFRHGGFAARHSQLIVIDLLYIRVAQLAGDHATDALARTAGVTAAHAMPAERTRR